MREKSETKKLITITFPCPHCGQDASFTFPIGNIQTISSYRCPSCAGDVKAEFAKALVSQDLKKHRVNRKKLLVLLSLNSLVIVYLLLYLYNGWGSYAFGVVLFVVNFLIFSFVLQFTRKVHGIIKHLEQIQKEYHL